MNQHRLYLYNGLNKGIVLKCKWCNGEYSWQHIINHHFDKILEQIEDCEICGDGIPKDQMKEHLEWCKK